MRYEIRPLGLWTDPETPERHGSGVFKAGWQNTLDLLTYETEQLDAGLVIIQVDVQEGGLRRDGMLKAVAKVGHPGVAVSFESKFGPLRYATDRYAPKWAGDPPGWQANVRAVALGLQALRAVDRYGVSKRGEQYRGWNAISGGNTGSGPFTTEDEARQWMRGAADIEGINRASWSTLDDLYKKLAVLMHPDMPAGSADRWDRLDAAATLLGLRGNKDA